jgi:hypothetical protein
MRRAGALGCCNCVDDVRRVHTARTFLGMQHGFAMFTDINSIFNMERPAAACPPGHSARAQFISSK